MSKLLLTGLLGVVILTGCQPTPGPAVPTPTPQNPATVAVVQARQASLSPTWSAVGTTEAVSMATVVAQASGTVQQVQVKEGDLVTQGQLLVTLDTDQSSLDLAQAQARLDQLDASLGRAQQLRTKGLLAESVFEQQRYDRDIAQAARDLVAWQHRQAQVRAPIAGIITALPIKRGQLVQWQGQVATLVDPRRQEVTVHLPERAWAGVASGASVGIHPRTEPGTRVEGRVSRVSPTLDASSGTFRVTVALPEGTPWPPGRFVSLELAMQPLPAAVFVPVSSLIDTTSTPAVWVVRDGHLHRVEVKLGPREGTRQTVEGLEAGEWVAQTPAVLFEEGQTVKRQPVDGDGDTATDGVH